jgi:hypothetical protein
LLCPRSAPACRPPFTVENLFYIASNVSTPKTATRISNPAILGFALDAEKAEAL